MKDASGGSIDTRGWDTVSAVRIGDINAAIRAAGTTPEGFADHVTDDDGNMVQADGAFEAWQMTTEGDSQEITMSLPMAGVSITARGKTKRYDTAVAQITARLELLPTDTGGTDSARLNLLVMAEPTKETPISVDNCKIEGGDIIAEIRLGAVLEKWLNRNAKKFTHVFAAVMLHNAIDESEAFAWLRPTHAAYAFGRNAASPENSILAVLNMTEKRSPSGQAFQVEQSMIPKGYNAAFAISSNRVLHKMIAESLPVAYEGMTMDDIVIDDDAGTISLAEGKTPKIKNITEDGKSYDVFLIRLDITLSETSLRIETSTRTDLFLGVSSVCDSWKTYGLKIGRNKKNEQTLLFDLQDSKEPEHRTVVTDPRKNTEKWLLLAAAIIGVIGLVIIAIAALSFLVVPAAILTLALWGLALSAVLGIIGGLLHLQQVLSGEAGKPLNDLLLETQMQIKWCAGSGFAPGEANLSGALQIAGSFTAVDPVINTLGAAGDAVAFQEEFSDIMQKRAA